MVYMAASESMDEYHRAKWKTKNEEEVKDGDASSVCSVDRFSVGSAETVVVLPRGSRTDEYVQVRVRNKRTGTVDILKVKKGTNIRKLLQDYSRSQDANKYKIVKVSKPSAKHDDLIASPPNHRYSRIGSDVWLSKPLKKARSCFPPLFIFLFAAFSLFLFLSSATMTPTNDIQTYVQTDLIAIPFTPNTTILLPEITQSNEQELEALRKASAQQEALFAFTLAAASLQKPKEDTKELAIEKMPIVDRSLFRTVIREASLVISALAFGRFMPPARLVRATPAAVAATAGLTAATVGRTSPIALHLFQSTKSVMMKIAASFCRIFSPTISKCMLFLIPQQPNTNNQAMSTAQQYTSQATNAHHHRKKLHLDSL